MKFRVPIKQAGDIYRILRACSLVRPLSHSPGTFRKKLEKLLAEKGGDRRLCWAIRDLVEFASGLYEAAPCNVEAEIVAGPGGNQR